ncbi:MAG: DUF881 domain-containing protein [Syntrophomonadaceae bacterium]|jgi:uncharacterized protein YlxW (UPF0749 family)|nr:DUF881 domain-containing protein [Bacillota bacterium]NLM88474.1 DUF881 domain-containing protein [Syntrophomonadaceae bacterium]HAA08659.1 hypothetical protein [Syntrophomonas sp.]HQA49105.1 DUF881 domain-containing protein [Syntrophomonadaceae bacterium]HQD90486.1 DUF881 domain-containing protein [Syntrophomonadaceae bacterium]
MRSKGAQISIALVCMILGIMLAVQFRTTASIEATQTDERLTELTQKVQTLTEEREALAEEVLTLRSKIANFRQTDQALADLQEEVTEAHMAAGLIPVEGPGIVLTLNDSPLNLQVGENANAYIIHDRDLLLIVNELKASGAEAISINGKRLTAMSEIRCAGTTILVNWDKIAPPFEIKVVGNPDMLESGLLMRGGYLEQLKVLGMQVQLQKMESVEIPAYTGSFKFTYGMPIDYEEKAE